jgi:hypothetical protein
MAASGAPITYESLMKRLHLLTERREHENVNEAEEQDLENDLDTWFFKLKQPLTEELISGYRELINSMIQRYDLLKDNKYAEYLMIRNNANAKQFMKTTINPLYDKKTNLFQKIYHIDARVREDKLYGNIKITNTNNDEILNIGKLICDPVGFRQHKGECWVDSIMQLVLFDDNFRATTQPFFFSADEETIRGAIRKGIPGNEKIEGYVQFFVFIKKRLINKYKTLSSYAETAKQNFEALSQIPVDQRREELDMCLNPQTLMNIPANKTPDRVRLNRWAEQSRKTVKGQRFRRGSLNYATGALKVIDDIGSPTNMFGIEMLNNVIKIFQLRLLIISKKFRDSEGLYNEHIAVPSNLGIRLFNSTACFCGGFFIPLKNHQSGSVSLNINHNELYQGYISKSLSAHAVCFYKCNGKIQYFDDNRGIFNVPDGLDITKINAVLYDNKNGVEFMKLSWNGLFLLDEYERLRKEERTTNNIENTYEATIYYNGEMQPFTDVAATFTDRNFTEVLQFTDMSYIVSIDSFGAAAGAGGKTGGKRKRRTRRR